MLCDKKRLGELRQLLNLRGRYLCTVVRFAHQETYIARLSSATLSASAFLAAFSTFSFLTVSF